MSIVTTTKKEPREFIRERSCTTHYRGKKKVMYVRGEHAARVIEDAEKQYPHRHLSLLVDTGLREPHPLSAAGKLTNKQREVLDELAR